MSESARMYNTTRKTVRKWLIRYRKYVLEGLNNKSRLRQKYPQKMPEDIRQSIIDTKGNRPWGARRIKEILSLSYSHQTIHKKLKQAGKVKKKKKRYKIRKNMSPKDILKEKNKNIDEYILNIPPIISDNYIIELENIKKGGYLWCRPPTDFAPKT
ncbi:MAG: helix-turn-helix domain-containing protein [Candidatus Cloacimonadota bacterium]|nr:helix-turn-helix domain-containing protein [Candidatus Cloacimonadota bacterium]